jgi:hypothetical protein
MLFASARAESGNAPLISAFQRRDQEGIMPYSETTGDARLGPSPPLVLAEGLLVVFFLTEGLEGKPQVSSYDIILWAALFLLITGLFFLARRGERFLAPLVFMMDGVAIAVGVAISGGPVSYLPALFLVQPPGRLPGLLPPRDMVVIAEHALPKSRRSPSPIGLSGRGICLSTSSMTWRSTSRVFLRVPGSRLLRASVRWGFLGVFVRPDGPQHGAADLGEGGSPRTRERVMEQKRRLIQMGEMTGAHRAWRQHPLGLLSGNLEIAPFGDPQGHESTSASRSWTAYVHRAIGTLRRPSITIGRPCPRSRRGSISGSPRHGGGDPRNPSSRNAGSPH